jgi:hypothetical protein
MLNIRHARSVRNCIEVDSGRHCRRYFPNGQTGNQGRSRGIAVVAFLMSTRAQVSYTKGKSDTPNPDRTGPSRSVVGEREGTTEEYRVTQRCNEGANERQQ